MLEPLLKWMRLHTENDWLQPNAHISFDCLSVRRPNGQTR